MDRNSKIKVNIEAEGMKASFEGDVEEVFRAISSFLFKVYPNMEIARKIIYSPDILELSEKISNIIKLTDEGPVLDRRISLSARKIICLVLLASYIGFKLGRLERETLTTKEIARISGKARKTITNEVPWLIERGLIEKTSEGEYCITSLGIKHAEEILKESMVELED